MDEQKNQLPLKIGERQFLLDRSDIEKQVEDFAGKFLHDKVGTTERLLVKGAIRTLFTMKGIPFPDDMDLLDYVSQLILKVLTEFWAENGLVASGEEVTTHDTENHV